MRIINFYLIVSYVLLLSCNNDSKLSGTYSTCYKGLYTELYFKKDSFAMANELNYITKYTKYDIINDTIHHIAFGDPIMNSARIEISNENKFNLFYPDYNANYFFKKIDFKIADTIKWEEFWNKFKKRHEVSNCY